MKLNVTVSVQSQKHRRQIQLHGTSIQVQSNDAQIMEVITGIYSHIITAATGLPVRNAITVIKNDFFHVRHNGLLLFSTQNMAEAITFLEWSINNLFLKKLNRFLQIHAGAAALNNHGILFPATNDVGKSTFTYYVHQQGLHYLSDEIGFIDPETKRLFPFPKSIGLDKNSFKKRLKDYPQDRIAATRGAPKLYFQPKLRKKDLSGGVPLTHIFFLKRDTSTCTPLIPCSRGTAVINLIANSFTPLAHGEKNFARLIAVLTGVKTFYLNTSNLKRAYRALVEVIKSS